MQNITLRVGAGDLIFAARRILHLDQDRVAAELEVSKAWVDRIEKGKLGVREYLFQCLCTVLQLNWLDLVEQTPTITKRNSMSKKPPTIPTESYAKPEPIGGGALADIFFAVPMDALGDGYGASRDDVLTLLGDIRKKFRASKVFCAVEGRIGKDDFDDEAIALRSNLAVLRHSTCMVAVVPSRVVTSVLVEVGAAIAYGKPVVLFIRDRADLPFLLRQTAIDPPLTVIKYNDNEHLRTLLAEAMRILKPNSGWLPPASSNS